MTMNRYVLLPVKPMAVCGTRKVFRPGHSICGKTIQAKDVSNLLGIIDTNLFFQVTDFIKEGNVEGGIELSSKIFVEGYEFKRIFGRVS